MNDFSCMERSGQESHTSVYSLRDDVGRRYVTAWRRQRHAPFGRQRALTFFCGSCLFHRH